eukprot:scpid17986/ scgid8014/ Dynactin subunit 1; 150 kDa dynein-associated polypeptide; DAP-150; p150-glued
MSSPKEQRPLKVGCRVEVKDKGLSGTVAYVGSTFFADGKWIGVILDEAKGKNDGTVKGKRYFTCKENFGIFVRQTQVAVVDDVDVPSTPASKPSLLHQPPSRIGGPSSAGSSLATPSQKSARAGSSIPSSPSVQRHAAPKAASDHPPPSSAAAAPAPQAPTPAAAAGGATAAPASKTETADSGEITDLKEQVAFLLAKRNDDKTRLKELEKIRLQYHQMQEYKARWTESMSELQQQLKAAKKEAKEAVEAREQIEEETADLRESMEMATLDKEMAEERAEGLQQEVDSLKERVEELELDLEIMKDEMNTPSSDGTVNSAQVKQLEQQMGRLKDALVKLRDVYTQEKERSEGLQKDNEKQSTQLKALSTQKEKLAKDLAEAESNIDELKEQVDIAVGAEQMVEQLTDKNLDLEEQLQDVQESCSDLEQVRDMQEEMIEHHDQIELDLREDVDLAQSRLREAERRVEAANENVVDLQHTIGKFRELVRQLQQELQQKQGGDASVQSGAVEKLAETSDAQQQQQQQLSTQSQAMLALNMQLQSTAMKAHAKTIELELRKLDVMQASKHVDLLMAFIPESFFIPGGDHDAVLVVLLLARLLFKSELLYNAIREQFRIDDNIDMMQTTSAVDGERLTFVSNLSHSSAALESLLRRIERVVLSGDVELFLEIGAMCSDMKSHERAIDHLIDLVSKDQLDENVSLASFKKTVNFFKHVHDTLQLSSRPLHHMDLLNDRLKVITSGVTATAIQLRQLRVLTKDGTPFCVFLKELQSYNGDVKQAMKKMKRHLGQLEPGQTVVFGDEVVSKLQDCMNEQQHLLDILQRVQNLGVQQIILSTDQSPLPAGSVEQFAYQALKELSGSKESFNAYMQSRLTTLSFSLGKLATGLEDGEYDSASEQEKVEAPYLVRAKSVKQHLHEMEGMGDRITEKDADITELKKTIKAKMAELAENKVKIEMMDKKAETASKEAAAREEAAHEKVNKEKLLLKEKEKEFEEALDALQMDIDQLEKEKRELHRRLEASTRKSAKAEMAGLGGGFRKSFMAMVNQPGSTPSSPAHGPAKDAAASSPMDTSDAAGEMPAVAQDSPLLLAQVESLKSALSSVKMENLDLKKQISRETLSWLTPLPVRSWNFNKETANQQKEQEDGQEQEEGEEKEEATSEDNVNRVRALYQHGARLREDLELAAARVRVVDITGKNNVAPPRIQLLDNKKRLENFRDQCRKFEEQVHTALVDSQPGARATTDFSTFSSKPFAKALQEQASGTPFAQVNIPRTGSGAAADATTAGHQKRCVDVVLRPDEMRQLHRLFVPC